MAYQAIPTLCLFELAGLTYGVPAEQVQEFIRMVAITPLPAAPAVIAGFINVRSELVPVVNLKRRFGLAATPPRLSDFLLIVNTTERKIALWVDHAIGVVPLTIKHVTDADRLSSHTQYLKGVVEAEDNNGRRLVLVQDLRALLNDAETKTLLHTLDGSLV
jgi:purine-binding chemotaxis protein CheW